MMIKNWHTFPSFIQGVLTCLSKLTDRASDCKYTQIDPSLSRVCGRCRHVTTTSSWHDVVNLITNITKGIRIASMHQLVFRIHALKRMRQRHICEEEVRSVVANGEVIEDYPNAFPFPCRLMMGWYRSRCLHVVVAENAQAREIIIITTYEPNNFEWELDFKRRKL